MLFTSFEKQNDCLKNEKCQCKTELMVNKLLIINTFKHDIKLN